MINVLHRYTFRNNFRFYRTYGNQTENAEGILCDKWRNTLYQLKQSELTEYKKASKKSYSRCEDEQFKRIGKLNLLLCKLF